MNARRRVVISGAAAITSAGDDLALTCRAVRNNVPAIVERQLAVAPGQSHRFWLAAVPDNLTECLPPAAAATLNDLGLGDHRDLVYTVLAIRQAIQSAELSYDPSSNTIGVILAFEAPGMERVVTELFASLRAARTSDPAAAIPALGEAFYRTQSFLHLHAVGKCFKLHGFSTTVNNACSSGVHALELAAARIRAGAAEAMLIAGGECFETGVRPAFFERLGYYATSPVVRPFSGQSTGFVVGEGAAALLLESHEHALRRKAPILAEVHPASFAQQSWHQTLPNVRDNRLRGLIGTALGAAGASEHGIDLVVGHGAATQVSDEYELSCLRMALADRGDLPPVVGFKGIYGHMLAASAIADIAVAAEALRIGGFTLVGNNLEVKTVLKTATGFTGHDAAVVLTPPPRG